MTGREGVLLDPEAARRFKATYQQVALAMHQLLRRAIPGDPRELLRAARQQLQQQPDLLERAVKQLRRRQLQPDGEVIEALRQLRPSQWLFLKDLRTGAIFLDREWQAAYSVAGLTQSPGKIIGPGSCLVETALCPFAGRILCDGIFLNATPLEPELERRGQDCYRTLKAAGRVYGDPARAPLWTSAQADPPPTTTAHPPTKGRPQADSAPTRPNSKGSAAAGHAGEHQLLQAKLANLVARQHYTQAIRVREQALRRHPDLELRPSEAQLWCLEGRQAWAEGQPQRAETALARAVDLGLEGEPHYLLARLWLERGQPERGLTLLQESFEAGSLPLEYAGAYLKLLLISGQPERVRELIRQQRQRFQPQQIHWAAGALSLLDGDPTHAQRQFRQMTGPASPGDLAGLWRAWAALEAGDATAAAAALQQDDHPARAAFALAMAASTEQRPGELLDLERRDLPRRGVALALELLHQLRQQNLLSAAQLLLNHERLVLAAVPELAALRRPLLLLAGQQALEREAPDEAIRCWRPIVDRPSLDAELALRLYPLLDQGDGDTWPEAERLASQLLGWVRRSARDNPAAWPQPLLSHTQARLHCWQVDQHLRLGMRQQARRSAEQARQLAPELPDVIGRQGMLAYVNGQDSSAISLLWQALDNGCRASPVYEVLEEALEENGQQAERLRLQREHGASFGITPRPESEQAVLPTWLDALSQDDAPSMATMLSLTPERGPGLEVLRIFVDHVLPPGGSTKDGPTSGGPASFDPRKVTLDLTQATIRWDALIAARPPTDRVEAITALLVAIQRFTLRTGKAMRSQIESRLAELEELAAEPGTAHAEQALQNLLLLAGLRLRRQEALRQEAARLLRRSHQPERLLPRALLDLRLLTTTKPWQAIVDDLHRQDPQNPLLLLALATMQRTFTTPYERLADQAFELARRQQDSEALAACRRERWWAQESYDRELARRKAQSMQQSPGWHQLIESFDIRGMLEAKAREEGIEPLSEKQLQAMLPDLERRMAEAFARTNGMGLNAGRIESGSIDKGEDNGDDGPAPRQRGRRRTFMDL